MKIFRNIFLLSFVGAYIFLFTWLCVVFLAADDINREVYPTVINMFSDRLVYISGSALNVLSWGASTKAGVFLCGFPLSAALFALIVTIVHDYWTNRKTKINNNAT